MFLIILGFLINFSKSYATSASISPKNKTVKVGEPVKVTGTINAASGEISLTGANKIAWNSDDASNITKTISTTFTPQEEGTTKIILSGKIWDENSKGTQTKDSVSVYEECVITAKGSSSNSSSSTSKSTSDSKEIEKNLPIESTKKTTDTSNKSRNNYLSSIKISDGTLSPEFNRETTEYTTNFDDENTIKNLDKIKITATAEDKKSKVTGTGEKALTEGDNKFSIKVTSESGDTRTYVISLNKPADTTENADNLKIETLEINAVDEDGNQTKVDLDKDFNPDELEYSINVDENIKSLSINAKVGDDTIVTIDGADNLLPGENIVTVTLTSKNDETIKKVYTIKVNKAGNTDDDMENLIMANEILGENSKRPLTKSLIVGLIILIAILVVVLITLLVVNKKKKKNKALKDEDIDDEIPDEEFDNSDSDDKKEEKEELTSEEPKEEKENGNNDEIENDEAENADSSKYEDDSKDKNFEENDEEDNNKKIDDEEDFEEDSSDDWNNGDNTDWKKGKRHKGKHF